MGVAFKNSVPVERVIEPKSGNVKILTNACRAIWVLAVKAA